MAIEDAFLHDILARPDDDAPRLIYADWLEEHNNPRGEFIRVQCALAQLAPEDPRRWPLEQRERELLVEHEPKWLPGWNLTGEWQFRRGFVDEITVTSEEYLRSASQCFEQAPIRHLRLRGVYSTAVRSGEDPIGQVARSPYLSRLSRLSLLGPLDPLVFLDFAFAPDLQQLTELRLSGFNLEEDDLIVWRNTLDRPRLRRLDLSRSQLSPIAFRMLTETPLFTDLVSLSLAHTDLTLNNLGILAHSPVFPHLTELNLNGNRLTLDAIRELPEGALLEQLETLYLDANLLGDVGVPT